jgi:hypothetical protein
MSKYGPLSTPAEILTTNSNAGIQSMCCSSFGSFALAYFQNDGYTEWLI